MTVREAQERVDAIEFNDWRAYFAVQPRDADRIEGAIAFLTMTVASMFGGNRSARLQDFLPSWGASTPERQTDEHMLAAAKAFAARMKAFKKRPE